MFSPFVLFTPAVLSSPPLSLHVASGQLLGLPLNLLSSLSQGDEACGLSSLPFSPLLLLFLLPGSKQVGGAGSGLLFELPLLDSDLPDRGTAASSLLCRLFDLSFPCPSLELQGS